MREFRPSLRPDGPRRGQPRPSVPIRRTDRSLQQIVASLILVLLCLLGYSLAPLAHADALVFDLFFRLRGAQPTDPSIVIVDIDEESLQALGRWPWPRRTVAELIRVLKDAGAAAIIPDMVFPEPSTPEDDAQLAAAIAEAKRLYLPVTEERVSGKPAWLRSLPLFEEAAAGGGHMVLRPDPDGIVRSVETHRSVGGELRSYVALELAQAKDPDLVSQLPDSLIIDWAGPSARAFHRHSSKDLVHLARARRAGDLSRQPPADLKGATVFIGFSAYGHYALEATPLERAAPAASVHATVLSALLQKRTLARAPPALGMLILAALSLFVMSLFLRGPRTSSVLISAAVLLGWPTLSFLAFCFGRILIDPARPVIGAAAMFSFSAVWALAASQRELLRLYNLATRDGLTGLYVVAHFRTLMSEAVADALQKRRNLCVLMVDVDHFKRLNDTYGHAAGDEVLRWVAITFEEFVRTQRAHHWGRDQVGRYGGEEFIALLDDVSLIGALAEAERLRASVEALEIQWEGSSLSVTVSVGVATLGAGETTPDPMVRRADAALYVAKHSGRNRVASEEDV